MMQYEIRELVFGTVYADVWAPDWDTAIEFAIRFHYFAGQRKYFYVKPIGRQ